MICRLVKYEILTVVLLLWWGTLLAAAQYWAAVTPTEYQGGVEVELHLSHMTIDAGLVLVGSWNLSFASAGLEGASP
jgi:hypothetical protein